MSESKHTPGTWRLVVEGTMTAHWYEIVGEDGYYEDGSPEVIARTDSFEILDGKRQFFVPTPDAEEVKANAHLIAAAPDLLEALGALLGRYVDLVNSGDAGFWNPEGETVVLNARDAIAKARGKAVQS